MRIGLNLPAVEGSMAGGTARWADLLSLAREAEAAGFDSLWMPDHLQVTWSDHTRDAWECWTLLAALAAVTSRVSLGSLVTPTIWRNPALLAKMAASVDEISGGRLVIGLGAGWQAPEYAAFGYPTDHLVDRFEEALAVIVPLLRTGRVAFDGTYYTGHAELRLRGPRASGPPILIGAKGPRMLRLAARHADGWNAQGPFRRADDLGEITAAADAACRDVGRDPRSLRRSASVVIDLGDARGEWKGHEQPEEGRVQEVVEVLRGFACAGLDEVQVWLVPTTGETLKAFGPVLERLATLPGCAADGRR
jgi:alkanesulfonate monooxygenase SsuD/methylene tetrahydromethanopterin reductase-like flavin-dependent oxidoreductase (luciferase family)